MVEVLFIISILLAVIGTAVLLGYEKYFFRNPINKKERVVSGIIFILTGLLLVGSSYLALFAEEPNWLIDNVFKIFT